MEERGGGGGNAENIGIQAEHRRSQSPEILERDFSPRGDTPQTAPWDASCLIFLLRN